MSARNQPTARLRRTFQYPDDDSDNDSQPEAMDEQEQESYIKQLSSQNSSRNAQNTAMLLILPALSAIPYLFYLFRPSTSLLSILALSSLFSTAYLLRTLPAEVTGIAPLDSWSGTGGLPGKLRSPLDTHLPYLNAGLTTMLALMELVASLRTQGGGLPWFGIGYLPGIVYGAALAAKLVMAGVDPERELSSMRYEYRGA